MKKFALGFGGILGVLLLLAMVLLIGGCSSYNKLVSLSQGTDRAWADVQNVYQRRLDLIPNLVSTVQGAANAWRDEMPSLSRPNHRVVTVYSPRRRHGRHGAGRESAKSGQ